MSYKEGGYFGVKDMWYGNNNAVEPQSGFWNKVDAIGVFFMRFEVILWIISIVISILAFIFAKEAVNNTSNVGTESSSRTESFKYR